MNAGTDIRAGRPSILRCAPKCGCDFRRGRAFAATDPSTDRADLEHLAVIAGFEGNAELAATIVFGHHRRHADDGFASGVLERRLHARLLAELDQVTRGRERQLEAPAL